MPRIYRVPVDPASPRLFLTDAHQNAGLLPLDGSEKAHLSRKRSFEVDYPEPVRAPLQFWFLAPGVIVYPEAMIGEDVYKSPYYCWAYHVELLSLSSATNDFRAMNTANIYPHPKTGHRLDLNHSYPLFRLEGEPKTDLFCIEGQAVPSDELKKTCPRYNLKGLQFEEVWSWNN
jgi:hypothetical protein